jgi:glycerol-3-phosphate dehydrogenase
LKTLDSVSYADYGGEGPTLVLVHGLGGCHLNWMPSAAMLAKHARVIAVDLVGFGRTPSAGRGFGLDEQATMLERFIEGVVREPAILVGNSMGGLVTMMTAARAPELVSGMLLVSPAIPPPDLLGSIPMEPAMIARQLVHLLPGVGELAMYLAGRRGGARGLFVDLLTLGCKDVSRVPSEVIEANVSLIAERMANQPFGHARSYLEATRSMLFHLTRAHEYAAAVRAPTTILHGTHDRLVPVDFSRAFVERHRHLDLQVLDDVGHVPQMETPSRFVSLVTSWIERFAPATIEEAPPSRAA